jgi:hypothetical protein
MSILNRLQPLAAFRAGGHPDAAPWAGVLAAGAGAVAAATGCFAVAFAVLPPHLVFPVLALGLLVAAASIGVLAYAAPPETGTPRLLLWDFAGVLSLLGLAAALFGEPEQAVALLERDR